MRLQLSGRQLRKVRLVDCTLDTGALTALAELGTLTHAELRQCDGVELNGLGHLRHATGMQVPRATGCKPV